MEQQDDFDALMRDAGLSEFDFRSPETIKRAFATITPAKKHLIEKLNRDAELMFEEMKKNGDMVVVADNTTPYLDGLKDWQSSIAEIICDSISRAAK